MRAMLDAATTRYPDAAIRRLAFPRAPGDPFSLRLRQEHEWTPNGRTSLSFAPDGMLLTVETLARPAGGFLWKLAVTLGGFALTLLGSLAAFSFWVRKMSW